MMGATGMGALGALLGTSLGPVGTFAGGIAGGVGGWFAGREVGEWLAGYLLDTTGVTGGAKPSEADNFADIRAKSGKSTSKVTGSVSRPQSRDKKLGHGVNKMGLLKKKAVPTRFSALRNRVTPPKPPKPHPSDINYRKKWMLRDAWLKERGEEPEEYVQIAPENYGQELSSAERYKHYGSFTGLSAQDMFKRDNPPIFNAPTTIDASATSYTWGGTGSQSGNVVTNEGLKKIRKT